ncbi:hypothetical protein ACFWO0_38305, partial [Streptomyces sp. NPDC058461]
MLPLRGGELASAFSEITDTVGRLECFIVFDGELSVQEETRLAFERLTQRHTDGCRCVSRAAAAWSAHYVAFDLLHLNGRRLPEFPWSKDDKRWRTGSGGRSLGALDVAPVNINDSE